MIRLAYVTSGENSGEVQGAHDLKEAVEGRSVKAEAVLVERWNTRGAGKSQNIEEAAEEAQHRKFPLDALTSD